jgi:hypothetical protein
MSTTADDASSRAGPRPPVADSGKLVTMAGQAAQAIRRCITADGTWLIDPANLYYEVRP